MTTALRSGTHRAHGTPPWRACGGSRKLDTYAPLLPLLFAVIRRSPAQLLLESGGFSGTIVLTMT
jgi:hypothetical protein